MSSARPVRPRIVNRSLERGEIGAVGGRRWSTVDGDHATDRRCRWPPKRVAVIVNSDSVVRQLGASRCDGVVQVDQVEQTLDDGEALVGDGRADDGEHRGPAEADERVGHAPRGRARDGAPNVAVHADVVGDLLRIPGRR